METREEGNAGKNRETREEVRDLDGKGGEGIKERAGTGKKGVIIAKNRMRVVEKINNIGRKLEMKEREERMNNIVIRNLEEGEWEFGKGEKERRGRDVRIEDDLTWGKGG